MIRRNVTRRDVAEKAGVSATTVSFVLNGKTEANISEETQQRVFEAARVLGYQPSAAAQALASGRTKTIGFVLEGRVLLASTFVSSQLQSGILSVAKQNNLRLLVEEVQHPDQKDGYLSLAQAKSIDGLIIPEPSLNDPAIKFLSDHEFPVVILGHMPETKLTTIDFDNKGGAQAITEHLLSLGHTRIACITLTSKGENTSLSERLEGYKKALAVAGIPFDERLVRYGTGIEKSGYDNMLELLEEGEIPTAVFGLNDAVALGAMAAIQEQGLKIPQSIAVAGFDDSPFARYLNPSLTTIKLSFRELGRLAGEMLVNLIDGQTAPGQHVRVPTQLIVRKSTDPTLSQV